MIIKRCQMIHKVLIFFIVCHTTKHILVILMQPCCCFFVVVLTFFLFHSRSLGNESYSFWRFCELLCPAMRLTFDNKMLQQLIDKMQ